MIGQLRHFGAVQTGNKQVRIGVIYVSTNDAAATHEEHPLAIGRDDRRGKTALRVGNDALFRARGIIDFPQFALSGGIGARTDVGRFALQRIGIQAVAIRGQEIVLHIVTPDADIACLLAGKENLAHVIRINGGIVLRPAGDLPADIPLAGICAENLVGLTARLREADIPSVRRIRKIYHGRTIGALCGSTLLIYIFNENVRGVVSCREVSQTIGFGVDVQDAVGEPRDPSAASLDLRHADIIRIGRDAYEIASGLFGYRHHGIIHVLSYASHCHPYGYSHRQPVLP